MRLVVTLMCISAASCDGVDDRSAWLHSTLADEHRLLLLRDPALVAAKYAAMAEDPYAFFRGSLSWWLAETLAPAGLYRAPTALGAPELASMLLVGDPHPENVGTFLAPRAPGPDHGGPLDPGLRGGATLTDVALELNDFDAATFGPPIHDLRRLATGLRLLAWPELDSAGPELDEAIAALASGYRGALLGQPPPPRGRILDDLVLSAFEDRLEAVDWVGPDHLDPTTEEARLVLAALSTWQRTCLGTCPAPVVKRLTRHLGLGVASLPLLRFQIRLEGATASDNDDLVVDVKEAREAPTLPLPAGVLPLPADHNAARVVFAQRLLQSSADLDPLLGSASLPDDPRVSFKVAERSRAHRGLSRERIRERLRDGRWTATDLTALGGALGHLLGSAHRRAPLGPDSDMPAGTALERRARELDLRAELVAWSRQMVVIVLEDHDLFKSLLARAGPTLEVP